MLDDLIKILTKKCDVKDVHINMQGEDTYIVSFIPSYIPDSESSKNLAQLFFDVDWEVRLSFIVAEYGVPYRIVKSVESVCKKYFKNFIGC